jgi:hypothetical protein
MATHGGGSGAQGHADASGKHRLALGKRLKIRSMVTVAGEVLPFFWPMRNFIHHNPLNGLEHLPFEEAVAEATRLFHARGWLPRGDYQRCSPKGIFSAKTSPARWMRSSRAWLAEQEGATGAAPTTTDEEVAAKLREILMAMLTATSQPAPGDRAPCAEDVLACLKRGDVGA